MFIKGNVRKDTRTPFITPVRYSVSVLEIRELRRINDTAVSVDISIGGLGMLTGYPLEEGHVLTFEDEINMNGITAKSAIVRWSGKLNGNNYRAGLKFV
jgi:hypothetical protein